MVANDCHLLQMVANGKQWLTVVANDTIGCHRQKNQPLAASKPFRVWSLQLVPMVTNGTNGKIYNGTIGKTPNAATVWRQDLSQPVQASFSQSEEVFYRSHITIAIGTQGAFVITAS